MFMPHKNQPRVKALFLRPDQFQCALCCRINRKAWTDEECHAEARANFGDDITPENEAVVCDDCYNQYMAMVQLEARTNGGLLS